MKTYYKYILLIALAVFTVSGISNAANGDDDTDKVKLYKKTEPTGNDDEYRITLNSFVTGTTTSKMITKPVDVMLVLDVSTSMTASKTSGAERLPNMVELFPGDQIGYLHKTAPAANADYHNYKYVENGTLRYRVYIQAKDITYNLAYFVNGQDYGYNNNNHFYWDKGTGWFYSTSTTTKSTRTGSGSKNNPYVYHNDWADSWTAYSPNANDKIYTDVKLDVLEKASREFIDEIYANAMSVTDGIDHRLGVVTYGGELVLEQEILVVKDNAETLKSAVSFLETPASGTKPGLGFDYAYTQLTDLYNNNVLPDEENRSKIVVMFTDGEPSGAGSQYPINTILTASKNLKDLGAKVYTVGLFGKDPDSSMLSSPDATISITQYMEWTSSEYPNAVSKTNTGDKNTDGVEYFQNSDGSDLSSIFKSIASSAGADTYELTDSDAAAIDVMSNDFELPAGMEEAHVTTSMWVCIGTTEKSDGEETIEGTKHKYLGKYDFIPYKAETTDTDKIYDGDAPNVILDKTNSKVTVNGFYYAKDDVLKKDANGDNVIGPNKKPVIDTYYGNWVGQHADGQWAGKMLEISFLVNLKSSSMGGYALPSNKASSGIYVNTGTAENPVYETLVKAFAVPVVDVPSIIIVKEGLAYGESAIFKVTRDTKEDYTTATTGDEKMNYTVMVSQTDTEGGLCYAIIKDLKAGKYTVTEDTNWTWAYTPATNFSTSQTRSLRAPVYGEQTEQQFKGAVEIAQAAETYGQTTDSDWETNEAKRYYVMNDALHLMFKFKNTRNKDTVLNDEAVTTNIFGEGGGSAEHGGTAEEEELDPVPTPGN